MSTRTAAVPIPPSPSFIYRILGEDVDDPVTHPGVTLRGVADAWADALCLAPSWPARGDVAVELVGNQMAALAGVPGRVAVTSATGMLTAALELLGETDITTVEAAALFALSWHPAWRGAAIMWLGQDGGRSLRSWASARPAYLAAAADVPRPDVALLRFLGA